MKSGSGLVPDKKLAGFRLIFRSEFWQSEKKVGMSLFPQVHKLVWNTSEPDVTECTRSLFLASHLLPSALYFSGWFRRNFWNSLTKLVFLVEQISVSSDMKNGWPTSYMLQSPLGSRLNTICHVAFPMTHPSYMQGANHILFPWQRWLAGPVPTAPQPLSAYVCVKWYVCLHVSDSWRAEMCAGRWKTRDFAPIMV